ncbi:MAG: trypsin-like peptidase domain-containing protein [Fibrobacteres bacterium]|nr:trypsin-like peptidase domain-containing protein [Fibrobacterota bacterium]
MNKFIIFLSSISLIIFFLGCSSDEISSATSSNWSNVVSSVSKATYMIGFKKSDGEVLVLGTGFAISKDKIATNAHVALAVPYALDYYEEMLEDTITLVACKALNSTSSAALIPLDKYVVHQGFTGLLAPDYAIFKSPVELTDTVTRATDSELEALTTAEDIGTLGFPGETAFYVDRTFPVPIFKEGTISALHSFTAYGTTGSDKKYVIQHNFDLTGGTSGSAIFNRDGHVIAINNSGWTSVSIGFGIRIDLLQHCLRRTDYVSIVDKSVNEFYPFRMDLGYYYSSQSNYISIGNSVSQIKRVFGNSPETLSDTDGVITVRYTDGYSYRFDVTYEDSIAVQFMISNTPGQKRLNKFREYFTDMTVGANKNSIDMMLGIPYKSSLYDDLFIDEYYQNGISFVYKQKGGFCSAIIVYKSSSMSSFYTNENVTGAPYLSVLRNSQLAEYVPVLAKRVKPRSFKEVQPFRFSPASINL